MLSDRGLHAPRLPRPAPSCAPRAQLHLAQRGGADLRGHLSKWNPDAHEQGIFALDWELRYFVLAGAA